MREYIVGVNENPTITVDGWNVHYDDWLIQREEIVRCRDCKYAKPNLSDHAYRKMLWCDFHCMYVKPGNFCSWA